MGRRQILNNESQVDRETAVPPPLRRPATVRSANVLFLITMALILTVGAAIQAWSVWIGLLGTELFLILLPTLFFVRRTRVPLREALGLHWPGGKLVALSFQIGIGLFLMAAWLGTFFERLLDYEVPVPPGLFPTSPTDIVLCFVSLALLPPICEEALFRGYIQRAYIQRKPIFGVVVVALMFSFWHLRFQQLVPLIPIAAGLGYVVWRSTSLIPGVIVHFTNNAMAAVLLITMSNRPDLIGVEDPPLWAALVGAVLTMSGLWLFHRITQSPARDATPPLRTRWLARTWPLGIAAAIYVLSAGGEYVIGRYPEVLAFGRYSQSTPPSSIAPTRWDYEVRNGLAEPVGRAEVRLSEQDGNLVLALEVELSSWEVEREGREYTVDESHLQQTTRWDSRGGQLVSAEGNRRRGSEEITFTLVRDGRELALETSRNEGPTTQQSLRGDTLVSGEWPWRLTTLPFSLAYARKVSVASPWHLEAEQSATAPPGAISDPKVEETHVVVHGGEPVWTPAGNFIAWRVTVGSDHTAWYDAKPPHTLLRYDGDGLSYLLSHAD